eukprot:ANDGO_06905.mRNA.1 hypothetical protein
MEPTVESQVESEVLPTSETTAPPIFEADTEIAVERAVESGTPLLPEIQEQVQSAVSKDEEIADAMSHPENPMYGEDHIVSNEAMVTSAIVLTAGAVVAGVILDELHAQSSVPEFTAIRPSDAAEPNLVACDSSDHPCTDSQPTESSTPMKGASADSSSQFLMESGASTANSPSPGELHKNREEKEEGATVPAIPEETRNTSGHDVGHSQNEAGYHVENAPAVVGESPVCIIGAKNDACVCSDTVVIEENASACSGSEKTNSDAAAAAVLASAAESQEANGKESAAAAPEPDETNKKKGCCSIM